MMLLVMSTTFSMRENGMLPPRPSPTKTHLHQVPHLQTAMNFLEEQEEGEHKMWICLNQLG